MALKFVDDIELEGKKVLARFDFNVPLDKSSNITDTTRIDNALDTIRYILDSGCERLIIMSHLGRPKGEVNLDYSLEPVAKYLAEKLEEEILLTESCLDRGLRTLLSLNQNKIIMLQNVRFHKEETANDHEFAKTLASYGDVYINDAFGTAHRKHASTYQINAFFNENQRAAGFLVRSEIQALEKIVTKPKPPFVAIVGGAKVSDKIQIIDELLSNVDSLLIGGAMAYPFLKAKGIEIGKSMCSDEDVVLAKKILNSPSKFKIVLPIDHVASTSFDGSPTQVDREHIFDDMMGLDIGPKTLGLFRQKLSGSQTVLWNGPMGLFENDDYANGTNGVAKILSALSAYTLIGGGDSVSAVVKSGLADKMSHISTGGGAALEYIEKSELPGIQALKFGAKAPKFHD